MAFAEGNMPPLRRRVGVQAHGVAMIIIQVIDLKTATSSLTAEMPPQFEVNSLNFNLVAP